MVERRSDYNAFLLRLWRADNGGQPEWRFSLEEVGTQQRRLFNGINALQTFLTSLMMERDEDDDRAAPTGSGSDPSANFPREDR